MGDAMAIADITNSPDAQAFAASLAAKYGISPQAAQDAMLSLLPTLSAGIEHATLSPGGIARLLETMAQGHHQDIISNPDLVGHPDTVADGNSIIGQLMPRGLPQATLQAAASQSGVPASLMSGMAPAIAVFLIGYLFRNSGGMLGNIIGSAMGGGGGGASIPQMPQMPPMGRPAMGGGMMPPMPDLRNLGTGNNPYGNIASTIRNGGPLGGSVAGSVRDVLGSALGFGSSRGIMGWIIRMLVLRYGMTILRGLLRSFMPRL